MSSSEPAAVERTRHAPRPSVGLLIAVAVVVTLVSGVVVATGARDVLVFANLIALYLAMGVFGGTVQSDLRNLAGTACALALCVVLPAFVSTWSLLLSGLIVVCSVAVLSFLPALGRRYAPIEQGIGLSILYAFGYQNTRVISAEEIVLGTVTAFLVVVLLRVLAGAIDPDDVLRTALATAVGEPSLRHAERAIVLWTRGPARTWTREVLSGALRLTAARNLLARDPAARALRDRVDVAASAVASSVSARTAAAAEPEALLELAAASSSDPHAAAAVATSALQRIDLAARERDSTPRPDARRARRLYIRTVLAAALSPASPQSRHALRLLVASAVTVPVAVLLLPPAFGVSLMMSVYGFLQLSWEGTLLQVRRRLIGVLVGGVLGGTASALLPTSWLTVLGIVVLVIGFSFATSSITILMGCIVFGLTIALAPTLDLQPVEYALGYLGTVALGALVATVLAFLTVPLHSASSARAATARARTATAQLLASLAGTDETTSDVSGLLVAAYRANHRVLPRRGRRRPSSPSPAELEDEHDALADLHLIAFFLVAGILPTTEEARAACASAASALEHPGATSASPPPRTAAEGREDLALDIVAAAIGADRAP